MKNQQKKGIKSTKKKNIQPRNKIQLQQMGTMTNRFDSDALLSSLLSRSTQKLMNGFSGCQKKVITGQFQKMIKVLNKKLASPDKCLDFTQRIQCKTQRIEFNDQNNNTKETIRKNGQTQRKLHANNNKSPHKNKKQLVTKQYKNSSVELTILPRKNSLKSPTKIIQTPCQYSSRPTKTNNFKPKRRQSGEDETIKKKKHQKQHYYLFGDNFVQIQDHQQNLIVENNFLSLKDQKGPICGDLSQLSLKKDSLVGLDDLPQIEHQHDVSQKNGEEVLDLWFNQQQKRNSLDLDSPGYFEQVDFVPPSSKRSVNPLVESSPGSNQSTSPLKCQIRPPNEQLFKQFYTNNFIKGNKMTIPTLNKFDSDQEQEIDIKTPSSYCQSDILHSPSGRSHANSINQRQQAIRLQLKTNQQILMSLLTCNKIDKKKYQKYMDMAIELYDQEMTETEKIKSIIQRSQNKTGTILKWNSQAEKIIKNAKQLNVQEVIVKMFQPIQYKQGNIGENDTDNGDLQLNTKVQTPLILKTSQSHQNPSSTSPQSRQDQQTQLAQLAQQRSIVKARIQQKTNYQLGFRSDSVSSVVPTSIVSIYKFIKTFFSFLKSHYLQQFLAFINMPYGYSSEQRLKYMQGYQQQEDEAGFDPSGIIYGLQQVIRPAIFEEYFQICSQDKQNREHNYNKIHLRMVFDAINQSLNQYRPYYLINGSPYSWTITQKALTYFFVREDCYEQLLQKVQGDVLKWSAGLCGLIIEEYSYVTQGNTIQLEQMFVQYTVNIPDELLQNREQKAIKQEKAEVQSTNFEWGFYDEFITALLYEVSSCVLEQLAEDVSHEIKGLKC